LKFKVQVVQNTPAGIITNIAEVDPDGPGTEGKTPSNPNDVTVLGVKKVLLTIVRPMPLLMDNQQQLQHLMSLLSQQLKVLQLPLVLLRVVVSQS
jgi:hypothetical protein